jgi:hypothetical protein
MNFIHRIDECADVVFHAYVKQGYYRPGPDSQSNAKMAYLREARELQATVLTHIVNDQVVGTLMCSVDQGNLPTDIKFGPEMARIRQSLGAAKLGYLGKFGVLPGLEDQSIGIKLYTRAVTEWAFAHDIEAIVMVVNPIHERCYIRSMGAQKIGFCEVTADLEKAPAALLLLKFDESQYAKRLRNQKRRLTTA